MAWSGLYSSVFFPYFRPSLEKNILAFPDFGHRLNPPTTDQNYIYFLFY